MSDIIEYIRLAGAIGIVGILIYWRVALWLIRKKSLNQSQQAAEEEK